MVKLKILIFNWRCWLNPAAGGAEVFTHECAKRFVKAGNEVTLFTSKYPGCENEENLEGIEVIRAGGKYTVYFRAKQYYKKRFKGRYDILVDEINTRPFMTAKFAKGEKIVALIHQLAREYWYYETPFPISIVGRYFLEDYWLRRYKNIPTVTVSESTKDDLEKLGFKRIFIVPEGLNIKPLTKVPSKNSEPTVIYVGRLRKVKQPNHALDSFRIVRKRIPNARLWIVGDGPLKEKLEMKAFDGVKIYGRVPKEKKTELLKKAHLLVFPGIREGWGLTVIEAASQGTPTIAYNVSGLKDSVRHMETGILTPPNQINKLAEAVIQLINNKGLLHKLSENALKHSKNFNWNETSENLMKIIDATVNDGLALE
ncbi:MAG: glycosyltransferase family 4 protein [Promethearchaeota archaeon]